MHCGVMGSAKRRRSEQGTGRRKTGDSEELNKQNRNVMVESNRTRKREEEGQNGDVKVTKT